MPTPSTQTSRTRVMEQKNQQTVVTIEENYPSAPTHGTVSGNATK